MVILHLFWNRRHLAYRLKFFLRYARSVGLHYYVEIIFLLFWVHCLTAWCTRLMKTKDDYFSQNFHFWFRLFSWYVWLVQLLSLICYSSWLRFLESSTLNVFSFVPSWSVHSQCRALLVVFCFFCHALHFSCIASYGSSCTVHLVYISDRPWLHMLPTRFFQNFLVGVVSQVGRDPLFRNVQNRLWQIFIQASRLSYTVDILLSSAICPYNCCWFLYLSYTASLPLLYFPMLSQAFL